MDKYNKSKKVAKKPKYLGRKIIAWTLVIILAGTSLFAGIAPLL